MTDEIAEIEIRIDGHVTKTELSGMTEDAKGWHVLVRASQGQKAIFKVKGETTPHHALITEVRAVDEDGNTVDVWDASSGTHHVSPPYPHETEFEIEVHNTNAAGPVPRGGGYFRVLDEGGGGSLASEPHGDGSPASEPRGGGSIASEPQGGGSIASEPQGGGSIASEPQGGGSIASEPRGGSLASEPHGDGSLASEPQDGADGPRGSAVLEAAPAATRRAPVAAPATMRRARVASRVVESPGNVIIRLRTRDDAAVRGHALLVGVPLRDLGGVDRCLTQIWGWLGPEYEVANLWTGASTAALGEGMDRLRDDVRLGDQVLVYYAGHGLQALSPAGSETSPVSALTTMDTVDRDQRPADRFITADQLVEWLRALARACGADDPSAFEHGAAPQGPSVLAMFDCCHGEGLLDPWPESEAERAQLLHRLADGVDKGPEREARARAPGVLWALAAGRDEVSGGRSSREVGRFTDAIVSVLRSHPGEPMWAVMDRLHARWDRALQTPRVCGPVSVVPLQGLRVERPRGWLPCTREAGAPGWRVELAEAAGWVAGTSVAMTSSLVVPPHVEGRVESLASGRLGVRVSESADLEPQIPDFAWAHRQGLVRSALVEVWGGTPLSRARVLDELEGVVREARDLGSDPRDKPERACVGLALGERGVTIRDVWGDELAHTSDDDVDAWIRWIERLAMLQDWLTVERDGPGWRAGAFELRGGTWNGAGDRVPWAMGSTPKVTPATPLWASLVDHTPGWPAYVGLFRVRADRTVEVLSRHAANGGLPLTRREPAIQLGSWGGTLRLAWPKGVAEDGAVRSEELVAVVSNRPLTFSLLGMEASPGWGELGAEASTRRPGRSRVKLTMLRLRYRLRG